MDDLIYRLRKRAEIRRQIPTRKSVLEGEPDRIADLLEEAANALEKRKWVTLSDEDYEELLNSGDWGGSLIYAVEKRLMEKNA